MNLRAVTVTEILGAVVIVAGLTAILSPVLSQAREVQRSPRAICLSNLKEIGTALKLYADDYNGAYPNGCYTGGDLDEDTVLDGPRAFPKNWLVDPFVTEESQLDYGCYGYRFYKFLMNIQLKHFIKNRSIFYCPSSEILATTANMDKGNQTYYWVPNWIYNSPGIGWKQVNYGTPTNPVFRNLETDPFGEESNWISERMIFAEWGVMGWDGPDAHNDQNEPFFGRFENCNHLQGYNALFFDGHVMMQKFGGKWKTTPATGWGDKGLPAGSAY
ncbi:MAG: DUF1559 family PulG-like putative transporter [Armatimonadota bacterium]